MGLFIAASLQFVGKLTSPEADQDLIEDAKLVSSPIHPAKRVSDAV